MCDSILAARRPLACAAGNQADKGATEPNIIGPPGNCPPPWLHPSQPSPQGVSGAVTCGSVDSGDVLQCYSGRGASLAPPDYPYPPGLIKPDLCAPGVNTPTCWFRFDEPGQPLYWDTFGGTSAAAPLLAGCMALLVQACIRAGTEVRPERIQEALERTAQPLSGQDAGLKKNGPGSGRVQVKAAFDYGRRQTPPWW
jgi:hypothetical protein